MTAITKQLADWTADLKFEDIPRRVIEDCKNQILSVIASVHAGHFTESGRTVSKTIKEWAGGKEATMIPSGERTSLHNAIIANTGLSMALDYDDYLYAGHTGHSAVLCTLALAERNGTSGKDFLSAQTAANEIEARFGIVALAANSQGQPSTFIHQIGGAVIGARVLGLDKAQTASAFGMALMQPGSASRASVLGSEGKVLLVAQPAIAGVISAELAAGGLRGFTEIVEHEDGFFSSFPAPRLLGAFGGLGKTWLTETLSFKIYPGSAYIDSTIDCVLHLARSHTIDAKKVKAIHVAASSLTLGMEDLAKGYVHGPQTPPTTLNFTLGYNAAVALMDKELTPRQFLRERMKDPAVWDLAAKVQLSLDEDMTRRSRTHSLLRTLPGADGEQAHIDLDQVDLSAFRASFGARVRIEMEDGRSFEADQEVPSGAAGRPADERRRAVEEKFRRETRYTLRKEKMEKAIDLISHLEDAASSHVREIVRLCCSERV